MKKIISFSLWGDNPKYTVGAVKNAVLAKTIYPDWKACFFVHNSVSSEIVKKLDDNGAEVYFFDTKPTWGASLYRLAPVADCQVSRVIFRDCDSRLSEREKLAVDEWEISDLNFHIMRDHPFHGSHPMLAGMFGCKTGFMPDIEDKIRNILTGESYHTDQDFISTEIWPLAVKSNLTHDEFFQNIPFPHKRVGLEYVGEPLDENDMPCHPSHREVLKQYLDK